MRPWLYERMTLWCAGAGQAMVLSRYYVGSSVWGAFEMSTLVSPSALRDCATTPRPKTVMHASKNPTQAAFVPVAQHTNPHHFPIAAPTQRFISVLVPAPAASSTAPVTMQTSTASATVVCSPRAAQVSCNMASPAVRRRNRMFAGKISRLSAFPMFPAKSFAAATANVTRAFKRASKAHAALAVERPNNTAMMRLTNVVH